MSHGHFLRAFREFGLVVRVASASSFRGFARPRSLLQLRATRVFPAAANLCSSSASCAISSLPRLPALPVAQGTFKKLYKMRTLKFGTLIGEDSLGNRYYENTVDYPYGQHRWVEYSDAPPDQPGASVIKTTVKSFYEVDASTVPAEWHLWLHHTTKDPPTAVRAPASRRPLGQQPARRPAARSATARPPLLARPQRSTGSTAKMSPQANNAGSSAPYTRNLGGVVAAHTPNQTGHKPRGYGLGNGLTGASRARAPPLGAAAAAPHSTAPQPSFPLCAQAAAHPARSASTRSRATRQTRATRWCGRRGGGWPLRWATRPRRCAPRRRAAPA
jgi:NADH:ubiquinone oxidoreductase subunit